MNFCSSNIVLVIYMFCRGRLFLIYLKANDFSESHFMQVISDREYSVKKKLFYLFKLKGKKKWKYISPFIKVERERLDYDIYMAGCVPLTRPIP